MFCFQVQRTIVHTTLSHNAHTTPVMWLTHCDQYVKTIYNVGIHLMFFSSFSSGMATPHLNVRTKQVAETQYIT